MHTLKIIRGTVVGAYVLLGVLFFVAFYYYIPWLKKGFEDAGLELPDWQIALIMLSDLCVRYWYVFAIIWMLLGWGLWVMFSPAKEPMQS